MAKIKIVSKIIRKGFPTNDKNYKEAHAEADRVEKKKNPREYREMKKLDKKLPQGELMGTHTKSGKVTESKKVPKRDRKGVYTHEIEENKASKRLEKDHRKKR